MNDAQLLRYSRHILLQEIGIEGQDAFRNAHALIIGAGGLGSPAAMYLAASGVGQITIVDDDRVDLTNLQRQILHGTDDVGVAKAQSAALTIGRLNAEVKVNAVVARADAQSLDALVKDSSVVLDCSDNFETRHAINRACVAHARALVSGAALRFDGQISVFDLRDASSPCYACLFPEHARAEELNCATSGVFAPLTGIIGAMQAAEALKCLAPFGRSLAGRLLLLDSLAMQWQSIALARDAHCLTCANRPEPASP